MIFTENNLNKKHLNCLEKLRIFPGTLELLLFTVKKKTFSRKILTQKINLPLL